MNNIELVSELFMECKKGSELSICNLDIGKLLPTLSFTLLLKWVLMLLTFGTRVPGGLFLPNMLIGALVGRIVGEIVKNKLPLYNIIPGVYAIVGAAALLSGSHRMTVSLIVIMFELTGNLSHVLPLMTAVMVAKWVADAFSRDSIFDSVIVQKGYPYLNYKHRTLTTKMLLANDLMDTSVETIDCQVLYRYLDLKSMLDTLAITHPSGDGGFPVLKNGRVLVGYISQNDLERALERTVDQNQALITFSGTNQNSTQASPEILEAIVQDSDLNTHLYDFSQFVNKAPISLASQSSAELVVELFMKLGIRTLLIINDGEYSGIIHKKQLLYMLSKNID